MCLWPVKSNENDNDEGTVVGWGVSEDSEGGMHENIPRQVQVKRAESQKCYEDYHLFATISSPRTFCARGVKNDSGPCTGDSGGGLFVQKSNIWHIQGIVSASFLLSDQCDVSKYSVYTQIASFSNWINKKTNGATSKKVKKEICSRVQEIYHENSYQKTLCMVARDLNYDQAKVACKDAGMELFVVNNPVVHDALVKSAGDEYPDNQYTRWWVNGQKTKNGNWFTYAP